MAESGKITLKRFALEAGVAAIAVGTGALIRFALQISVAGPNLPTYITFYPAVMTAAVLLGLRAGLFATVFSWLAADYWFIGDPWQLSWYPTMGDVIGVPLFLTMGTFMSIVAEYLGRSRERAAQLQKELAVSEVERKTAQQLAAQAEELAQQNEELSQQAEEMAHQNEELQQQSEQIQSLNAELTHRESLLGTLLDATRLSAGEQSVMEDICRAGLAMFDPLAANVAVLEMRHGELHPRAVAGHGEGQDPHASWQPASAFCTLITSEGRTGSLNDISLRPDLVVFRLAGEPQPQAVLCSPIRLGGQIWGAVGVYSYSRTEWTEQHFRLAEWLSGQSSHVLEALRAQEDLRNRERRYRSFVEVTSQFAWVTDPNGLVVEDIPALRAFTGQTYEQAKGAGWAQALHPDDLQHTLEVWNQAVTTRTLYEIEYRMRRHDGVYRILLARGVPILDERGNVLEWVGTCIDITDRKQAEEALRESEQRVRRKLDAVLSPEGDLATLELPDLINVEAFQSLMDQFYALTKIPMALIDLHGKVFVKAGWQRICTHFHRVQPELCKHCIESDTELTTNVPEGEFRLYQCKNGLWDVATPVFVAGRHVANLFTGQFLLADEPVNRDFFKAQARRYGLNEMEYMSALDEVPRMSRQMVQEGMSFLVGLSRKLSQLSYSNVKLGRLLAERDRLTSSLRESEHFYRQTLESIPGMVFTTRPDGHCDYQSQQWVDFTGVPMSEHLGDGWNKLLHPEDRPRACQAWRAAVEGRAPYDLEYRIRRHDGQYEWFKVRGLPIRDGDGQIVRWFGVAANIDAIKHAQDELRQTAEELARSNRDLEQFAYVASHDLQEPLRMVSGFVGMLRSRYHDKIDAKGLEYMDYAVEGALRMQGLVTDLLAYSRAGRGKVLQPVSVASALEAALANLKSAMDESGAAVTCDNLPTVLGDRTQLTQLFQNLISNAIKFRGQSPPKIHCSACRDGRQWILSVQDNGIGIKPEHFERIFLIFQRLHTRDKYPGTGVGLAICKRIIERHGGRIWLESEPGIGSTFYFTLQTTESDGGNDSRATADSAR